MISKMRYLSHSLDGLISMSDVLASALLLLLAQRSLCFVGTLLNMSQDSSLCGVHMQEIAELPLVTVVTCESVVVVQSRCCHGRLSREMIGAL